MEIKEKYNEQIIDAEIVKLMFFLAFGFLLFVACAIVLIKFMTMIF